VILVLELAIGTAAAVAGGLAGCLAAGLTDHSQVVGFSHSPYMSRIDVTWDEALQNPAQVLGMFLVTENTAGERTVHTPAIEQEL
jgi:hypothetical protein